MAIRYRLFLKGQYSVHCFLYCTRRMLSGSPRSWTSPSMGMRTIYRSTFIASSAILSSSTTDSSSALIAWVNGCGGTASNSTRRRPSSFGWDRSVVLPPVPSALSSSMEKSSGHHSRFAIWASLLIRPSVSLTMSPKITDNRISVMCPWPWSLVLACA